MSNFPMDGVIGVANHFTPPSHHLVEAKPKSPLTNSTDFLARQYAVNMSVACLSHNEATCVETTMRNIYLFMSGKDPVVDLAKVADMNNVFPMPGVTMDYVGFVPK